MFIYLKKKRQSERARLRWKDNVKINLQDVIRRVWIGLMWLRIGTGGGGLF
jgi:hypothetical protein